MLNMKWVHSIFHWHVYVTGQNFLTKVDSQFSVSALINEKLGLGDKGNLGTNLGKKFWP